MPNNPLPPAAINRDAIAQRMATIPAYQAFAFELLELKSGYAAVRVPRRLEYDGVFNSYHGGLMMTVADSCACLAILTLAGAEAQVTTTDMNIRFLAPCLTAVTAKATLIKFGRTLCPVAVDLFDDAGIKVAVAQVNYIRLCPETAKKL